MRGSVADLVPLSSVAQADRLVRLRPRSADYKEFEIVVLRHELTGHAPRSAVGLGMLDFTAASVGRAA
jgi:hypothetical protein